MIHWRFLLGELRLGGAQAITFVLCVALSIATLTALNSFKADVHRSLLSDAQALHGGDIIIHSHYPISPPLLKTIESIRQKAGGEWIRTYEFYSVVRPVKGEESLFVSIMAVAPQYPLYGTVELTSGRDFSQVLGRGQVVVAPEVLTRLGLELGDRLQVGSTQLNVVDTVVRDPSRPVSLFALGPRIFVSTLDLDELGLLGVGSRSQYEVLLKLDRPDQAAEIADQLRDVATAGQERVETATTARSQVKRFFDNLLFFLSFISIFTLLLSGIGMQTSLSALLRRKQATIAIGKALGVTRRFLFTHYLGITLFLGLLGSIVGVVVGVAIKWCFPLLFGSIIPPGTALGLTPGPLLEGMLVGLFVVLVFSALPLYRADLIRPIALLRHEQATFAGRRLPVMLSLVILLFLSLLVVRQLEDVKIGLYFTAGSLAFIAVIVIIVTLSLKGVRRLPIRPLALRQAQRSLFRPGNATRSIIVTLTAALAALLAIFLLQFNLVATFITSYPEDAPNLFCLDIQRDQQQSFFAVVGEEVLLFPVIRGRLVSINGEPIDYERENQRRSDTLAREFNLTYRDGLLDDEIIVRGSELFGEPRRDTTMVAVSVLDTIAEIGELKLGDRLEFVVQGVALTAEVTSIRSRTKSRLYPFFYFVFAEEVLAAAPQTFFAALHLPRGDIDDMVERIVTALPNVSTINVADSAERLGQLVGRLARVITFFSLFSIIAGCLILVGSVLATRLERLRDCVLYKIVGGNGRFVLSITVWENLFLGLCSSLIAVVIGSGVAWSLCRIYFDIAFRMHWLGAAATIAVAGLAVMMVGLLSSLAIIREKPMAFLARQEE